MFMLLISYFGSRDIVLEERSTVGDAGGESNTTLVALSLFLVENLGDLIFDESINLSADGRDITADNTLGSGESKGSYTIFWSKMFYRKSSCATHQI